MAKTLTDFILCNVSDSEARKFHKVLASNPVTGADSDDLARLLEKFYDNRDSGLWSKIFGPGSDPFDMTSDELERLLQVKRDPKLQIEFTLPLKSKTQKEFETIQNKVNRFMLKNSVFFDSMKDVFVDKEERELNYSGHIEMAEELLKELGYNKGEIKKILDQKDKNQAKKAPVFFFPMALLKQSSRPILSGIVTDFNRKYAKTINEPYVLRTGLHPKNKNKPGGDIPGLVFEGPQYVLERFLGKEGMKFDALDVQQILKEAPKYKV